MFNDYKDLESNKTVEMLDIPCIWETKEMFTYICKQYSVTLNYEDFESKYYISKDMNLFVISVMDYILKQNTESKL